MATLTHMKATILPKIGGPEGFEVSDKVPVPKLKDGFVIVRNTFASVNFIDVYFRTGAYPAPHGPNLIPISPACTSLWSAPVALKLPWLSPAKLPRAQR